MSISAAAWVQKQRLSNSCALVLRTIALNVNDKLGVCWLGQPRIAAQSNGISISTAKRCLVDLQALELIAIGKFSKDGHLHNTYRVDLSREVRWDGTVPWRVFVCDEAKRLQARTRLPGESKGAFVSRRLASPLTDHQEAASHGG